MSRPLTGPFPYPPVRPTLGILLLAAVVTAVIPGGYGTATVARAATAKPSTAQLEAALAASPDQIEIMLQLGVQYSVEQRYLEAVRLFQRVIQLDPDNFHAYNNLGIVYKKAGQLNDCLKCYQQALRINPDSYWVFYNLGLVYEEARDLKTARDMYARAVALNPDFEAAIERLRQLPADGSQPKLPSPTLPTDRKGPAVPPVKAAGAGSGSGRAPVVEQAGAGSGSGSDRRLAPPTGKTSAEASTRLKGPGLEPWTKAMAAMQAGDVKKAIDLYVRAVVTDPEFLGEDDQGVIQAGLDLLRDQPNVLPEGMFYRAYLLSTQYGADKQAIVDDLKGYLDLRPNGAFVNQAKMLRDRLAEEIRAQDAASAQVLAQQQLETPAVVPAATYTPRPSHVEVQKMPISDLIGEAKRLNREGRQRDALAVLQGGIDREPKNLELLMLIANTYVDLMLLKGDNEAGKAAREAFEQILAIAPDSKEGTLAKSMIVELNSRIR